MTSPIPTPQPAAAARSWRFDLTFLLLSLALMSFVFGGALTGRSLLAPLDLPGDFYAHYKWLEPHADGIPQNHYIVDIFDHELPRQYSIFQAVRRGEFPWWDPYTENGRPLVAEAHIAGTDPIRLALYRVLPFELAYNWSKILSSFLFGLGGYLLLRRLGFPGWLNVAGALAYQFASNHFLFQTPLCVTSSFAYYALLWWAWDRLAAGWSWQHFAGAGVLFACAVMAGNQQTHAYLALFTFCFLLGYGFTHRERWGRLLVSLGGSSILGCVLALPVLTAQIELFLLCQRSPQFGGPKLGWLSGVATPLALFPWATGTFRTLDAGKVLGVSALGFCLYIGSVGVILAGGGAWLCATKKIVSSASRTALLLVLAYVAICLTPLLNVLYTRCSDLAVLGLVVLAAYAVQTLASGKLAVLPCRLMAGLSLACLAAFLLLNAVAFLVVPRLEAKISRYVLEREQASNALSAPVPEFRRFQVANLAREISLRNPETVAAAAGALGLLALLLARRAKSDRAVTVWLQVLLAVNVLPLLLFGHRFTVRQPVELWQRLLHEDSPQAHLAASLGLQYRFQDPGIRFDRVYPGALTHLYGVHSTAGYSSFLLTPIADECRALGLNLVSADATTTAPAAEALAERPVFQPPSSGTSRFQWKESLNRPVKILSESLNRIELQIAAGPAGTLVRTDRFYPGWRVLQPQGLPSQALGRSLLAVQVPAQETRLVFAYMPRFLSVTLPLALAALAGCLGMFLWGLWRAPFRRA